MVHDRFLIWDWIIKHPLQIALKVLKVLTKVVARRGEGYIKAVLMSPAPWAPKGRKMVVYNMNKKDADAIVAYLKWNGKIDLNGYRINLSRYFCPCCFLVCRKTKLQHRAGGIIPTRLLSIYLFLGQ